MRKTSRSGSFFLVLLFNILLNFRLTIPGWLLLILYFFIPQYIRWWYCLVWFGAFLLYMLVWMILVRVISRWVGTAAPAPPIPNKNPYSSKGYTPINQQIENKNPYSATGYKPVDKE